MKPWHIFPVGRRSKDPLVADPFLFASNDKAQIDLWSTKYPGCNWGVALQASGLLALDVDCKNGAKGFESLARLRRLAFDAHGANAIRRPTFLFQDRRGDRAAAA